MSEEATLDEFVEESEKPEVSESTVPDDWQITRADEIMEITRGASPRPKGDPELFGGDIPWVKIGDVDVKNARYTGDTEDTVTEKGAEKSKLVDSGTLLVSNSGTCGYPMFAGIQSCVHDGWLILRDYEDVLNPHYLYEYIGWKQNYLKSLAPGSTQINLNTSRMGVLEINIPPLPEQRKIATLLYTVDRAIEKTEEIIEQTNRVRDGFIKQRVLATNSDKVRKEGIVGTRRVTIPENWSTVRLGDVAEIVSGKSFPREYQEGHAGSNAVIKVEDMNHPDNDKYIKNVTNRISEETLDKLNKNVFPAEAVIHPRVGEALLLNKMRLTTEKAAFDDNIMGWIPNEINPEYLYYASTMIDFNAVAQTGTVPSINKEMAANFRFPLPPEDEQMNIVEDLQRIDGQVSVYEREKNQLQRLKHGLQQDLLSGTVRTTDTNIEVPDEIAQHG